MSTSKSNFWSSPLTKSRITSDDVKMPEMLLGYFIGPFGALLSSGIFTSILQNYFTDVLKLDLGFLTTLQLVSTVLIVASNLIVGQLIEHTRALAGKARPWILLSALTLSVASVLMFIVPFEGMAKMVWIAIAYNLYYAVAYPIYNTANSTMIPVSTRDSKQRGALASFTNVAGLGVMGCGSMVFPMLVSFALKENQHLWFLTMLAVAIFSALTIYLQFLFTRERVTEEGRADTATPAKSATLGEQLKAVTGDRMWWIVMAFYMLFQWSGAMKNGSMSYFCKWVLDNTFFGTADAWGASQGLLSIMGAIPMAVAAVFVVPLANKFGKRLVCGGFMLLARGIEREGRLWPMSNVFPVTARFCAKPQGLGYVQGTVRAENPFFPLGLSLRGHEFHYSRCRWEGPAPSCALELSRGKGMGHIGGMARDGLTRARVWAAYTHIFAPAVPCWADNFVAAARRFREERNGGA